MSQKPGSEKLFSSEMSEIFFKEFEPAGDRSLARIQFCNYAINVLPEFCVFITNFY